MRYFIFFAVLIACYCGGAYWNYEASVAYNIQKYGCEKLKFLNDVDENWGLVVVECDYDGFHKNEFGPSHDGPFGLLDSNLNVILPVEYATLNVLSANRIRATKERAILMHTQTYEYFFDRKGNVIE